MRAARRGAEAAEEAAEAAEEAAEAAAEEEELLLGCILALRPAPLLLFAEVLTGRVSVP